MNISEIKIFVKNGTIKKTGFIAYREAEKFFVTKKGANLEEVKEEDFVNLENSGILKNFLLAIFQKAKNVNAIFFTDLPNIFTASKTGKPVKPMLDDMAQIVGISVNCVDLKLCEKSPKRAVKKMNDRTVLMIKDLGAICVGSSLEDATVSAIVFDKGCKTYIESSFLGGGVYISPFESWIMHKVYQLKYSKQAKK